MFFAAVFSSYGCALVLSLAMEMPVVHFDKLLFGPGGGGSHRFQTSRSTANTLDKPSETQKNGTESTGHNLALAQQGSELKKLLTEEKPIEKDAEKEEKV